MSLTAGGPSLWGFRRAAVTEGLESMRSAWSWILSQFLKSSTVMSLPRSFLTVPESCIIMRESANELMVDSGSKPSAPEIFFQILMRDSTVGALASTAGPSVALIHSRTETASSTLRILPAAVLGQSSSPKSVLRLITVLGAKAGPRALEVMSLRMLEGVTLSPRVSMTAIGTSPAISSGTPTTWAMYTPSAFWRSASMLAGEMFSPPLMMMSL